MFPVLSYNGKYNEETGEMESGILKRTIPTAMIYTMGTTESLFESEQYPIILGPNEKFLNNLFGYCESLCTLNSYQFSDYSKYDVAEFVEPMRAKYRDEVFPKDLEKAYELGKRLVEKAKEIAAEQ